MSLDRIPFRSRALAAGLTSIILAISGCETDDGLRLPSRASPDVSTTDYRLVARIAHVSDTHIVDEESPARITGAGVVIRSAWRPYEAYSTQLLDGILRAINRIHASGRPIDFVVLTGDACDNSQMNELAWLVGVFDGQSVNPLSGPDDRPVGSRPPVELDPHAEFAAQGLYRTGVHGDAASVPWYVVFGNHDVYSIGVFPIVPAPWGGRVAPLPVQGPIGAVVSTVLNPTGYWAHGNITPADPGPPILFETPRFVVPNPDRAFFNKREFVRAMFATMTGPAGHGFDDAEIGPTWYSVSPVPGLRLIGMDTCDPAHQIPGLFYQDGSISTGQAAYLRAEIAAAGERGELVVLASHHPSASLQAVYGTAMTGSAFRSFVNEFPNVVLHLAGHTHVNRVSDRVGYVEIETCSTLDLPQEGRLIEIWRREADGAVRIVYEMFSHLDDELPALGLDPLRDMRARARAIAAGDPDSIARIRRNDPSGADPFGRPSDRSGIVTKPARH